MAAADLWLEPSDQDTEKKVRRLRRSGRGVTGRWGFN